MTLMNTIRVDQVQARKDRKTAEATILTTLLGEAAMIGKDKGNRETTDDEVVAVIKKYMNGNKDIMGLTDPESDAYLTARDENSFVEQYLPKQLSEDELREIITPLAEGKTMRDMGTIMKELKTNYTGLYDGGVASSIIKNLLK